MEILIEIIFQLVEKLEQSKCLIVSYSEVKHGKAINWILEM